MLGTDGSRPGSHRPKAAMGRTGGWGGVGHEQDSWLLKSREKNMTDDWQTRWLKSKKDSHSWVLTGAVRPMQFSPPDLRVIQLQPAQSSTDVVHEGCRLGVNIPDSLLTAGPNTCCCSALARWNKQHVSPSLPRRVSVFVF